MTIRQALFQLEAEGLIYRLNRRGWLVSPPRLRYDPTANTSITESVMEQGRVAGTTILSKQQVGASQWESAQLGCALDAPIFVINRLRTVDERAILVEQIHVRAERCPGLLDYPFDRSMTGLMAKKFGIVEHRTQINMRPTALSEFPAKVLGVAVGTPSLYLSRTIFDPFNEVVELDQEFWRHDAIENCVSAAGRVEEEATA